MGFAGSEYHAGPGAGAGLGPFSATEVPIVPDLTLLVLELILEGEDQRELTSQSEIDLYLDGEVFNVTAEVNALAASVIFAIDGVTVATITEAPFTYEGWTPAVGVHRVSATPVSATNIVGAPSIADVTVVDTTPVDPPDEEEPPGEDDRPTNYVSPTTRFPAGGNFPYRCDPYTLGTPNSDTGDFWSDSGQCAYVPDGSIANDPGLAATAHFAYYRGTYATQPRLDIAQFRGVPNPDPETRNPVYASLIGSARVVKQVRSVNTTGNCAFVLWNNGLLTVATTQTGHGNVPWPYVQLPANKIVHDIAVTSNNELLLIALYDNVLAKGQLAVVMVEGRGLPFHTFSQMGLFNQASASAFKLLGYVDIPSLVGPFKVSAASNGTWTGPSATDNKTLGQITMTSASNLANLYSGAWQATVANGGYAVVTSQTENKLVVFDLSALFLYIRESWLSSVASFNATTAARAAGTWPMTFATDATLKPTVEYTQTITAPVSVLCGHRIERFSADRHKFHVGIAEGKLVIFDASHLMARFDYEDENDAIEEMGRFTVGVSPVGLCFSRRNEAQGHALLASPTQKGDGYNNVIWVACDEDQKVVQVLTVGGSGAILKTLRDIRMDEPVDVCTAKRGYILLVCDRAGKQVVGWRIGNITDARRDPPVTYTPGQAGGYEISGFLALPGAPFCITSENVN